MTNTSLDLSFLSVTWGADGVWIWKMTLMLFSTESNDNSSGGPAGLPAFGRAGERERLPGARRRRRGAPAVGGATRVVDSPSCPRRPRRAGKTLRPPSAAGSLVPGPPGGTRLAATPEGGGSGSGGAAAGSGLGAAEGFATRRAGDSGPRGTRRGARASAETMAEEEGEGPGVQRANCRP